MKRVSKNLTKAVTLSVLLMFPYGMAWADNVYTEAVTGSGDKYSEPIKKYDEKTNTYIYSFGEGAKLDLITDAKGNNTVGINAKNDNIVINGSLDIKMKRGEEEHSDNVSNGISVEGTNSLVDRRGGGNIEVINGDNAVSLGGDNNKIYLGKGDITLTNNTIKSGNVSAIGLGKSNIFDEENNLLVYGKGDIKNTSNTNEKTNTFLTISGVGMNNYLDGNNNKIILGYNGNYNDFEKFNDVDNLNEIVKNLECVKIEVTVNDENKDSWQAITAFGIGIDGAGKESKNNAYNIVVAGDVIIDTEVTSAGSIKVPHINTNGIMVTSMKENITDVIAVKSADITVSSESKQDAPANVIGISGTSGDIKADSLIQVVEKSTIEATAIGKGKLTANGIMTLNALSSDGIFLKFGDSIVNTGAMEIKTTTDGGKEVENIGIKASGGEVNVNGDLTVTAVAENLADKENNKVYGLWSTFGGNINVNGTTDISTSGGQDIAVVAGTENWTNVKDNPDGGTNNINLNYGVGSKITGDIISGYGGHIVIGTPESTEEGISTFSARNNNGTLTLNGDALSANGGKLDINLTAGSTWTGRADDYQDAALPNWKDDHEKQFNPKFSHSIAANGNVNVTLAKGATWNVTGQSWITELNGNGVVDLTKGKGSDAVHIGTVKGNNTFVVNLKPDGLDTSDMIYVQNGTSDAQTLQINNRDEVLSGMKVGDALRFATVTKAGEGFGNITDGAETFGKSTSINDAGIFNVDFDIIYKDYNDKMEGDLGTDRTYNGGNFSTNKPGQDYVDNVYGGKKDTSEINTLEETTETESNPKHVYIVRNSVTKENQSDAGKTIINMSRANYKNAIYMDRLNKRMGEMRYVNGEEEQGLWVRLRHDRIGQSGDFRSMNTMYEVGYDVKQPTDNGEHRIGMAIDYMRGSTTYDDIMGKGETKRYGLWLYDTWLGEKGHYVDYVAKWGHLSNDFDITAKTTGEKINGDYSNNVFSVSAEYGKKNDMGNNWYFEPQAQLQLARVTGADYVTTQGSKVNVDGINSLIGRAGFRIGRDMDENSTVYLKADLLHEFMGDQTVTAADATGTLREEFENKGTWYDVGFGFATKMSKNSYAFMDFEKSFGNDNDETYQINAGMQWSF